MCPPLNKRQHFGDQECSLLREFTIYIYTDFYIILDKVLGALYIGNSEAKFQALISVLSHGCHTAGWQNIRILY